MKHLSLIIVFAFSLNVAFGQQSETATMPHQRSFENICYKVTDQGDSILLDVFLPKIKNVADHFPVLVIIHGGAWVEGDKKGSDYYYHEKMKATALNEGFAVVSINYRLLNEKIHFPSPVADCKDAVRWIKANASVYHLDTMNLGLWGESAGAHLALLVAYSPNNLWQGSEQLKAYNTRVDYIIDNFGPTDLNKLLKTNAGGLTTSFFKRMLPKLYLLRNKLIFAMTGSSLNDKEDRQKIISNLAQYAPLKYVSPNSVPTLILQGTKDKVVPYSQSKALLRLLKQNHVAHQMIRVKKGNHGFTNIPKEEIDALVTKNILFMKSHLIQH